MKKLIIPFVVALMAQLTSSAATLRVNNTPGSGAQYSSFDEAQEAASDGDVIIFDGSNTSYGKITVSKKVTVKGPGYFLAANNATSEGVSPAEFSGVSITAEGATLTGLCISGDLYLKANKIVVTRCYIGSIYHAVPYSYSDTPTSDCVIHQNYIQYKIIGDSYSANATNFQITNNIFFNANYIQSIDNSTISRNIIICGSLEARWLNNCVIEHNLSPAITNDGYWNKDNSISDNHFTNTRDIFPNATKQTDKDIKELEQSLGLDMGAFSGDDPYVLGGLPTGPTIQDIIMPESVAKGENLKVTVKIGKSK